MPHPRALHYIKIALILGRVVECAIFFVKLMQTFTPQKNKNKNGCQHNCITKSQVSTQAKKYHLSKILILKK